MTYLKLFLLFPLRVRALLCVLCALGVLPLHVAAAGVAQRVVQSGILRVCIWPAYYSITYRNPRDDQLTGIDIELSAALAQDLGLKLQYVESSFVTFMADLQAERCDVAMFGVGITAQRQQQVAFTQPYMKSGIYGVTTRNSRLIQNWDDIDQPNVLVAVQAGTFMEPVMAKSLKKARLVAVKPPQLREQELEAGRVDVFMTDYPYSKRLLAQADWARLVAPSKPFNPIPYAYAVKQGEADWLSRVNAFVVAIKQDGRLEAAARRAGLSEIVLID